MKYLACLGALLALVIGVSACAHDDITPTTMSDIPHPPWADIGVYFD
ncbi:MAG: hypothetical protein WC370_03820 [Dehalococcoidales bacterium]